MNLRQTDKQLAALAKQAATQRQIIAALEEEHAVLHRRFDQAAGKLAEIERERNRLRKQKSRRVTGRN